MTSESITRDTVIKILSEHGYLVEERQITEAEFHESNEIFLCGSAAEITPIKLIGGKNFRIGDLSAFIFKEYQLAITAKGYEEYLWTTKLDAQENS